MDHGAGLVERVIESVRSDPGRLFAGHDRWLGPWIDGEPEPMAAASLESLTLPSGRPLPAGLLTWLAFDTGLLRRSDWFAGKDTDRLTPVTLTDFVRAIEIRGYEDADLDEPDEEGVSWNDIWGREALRPLARFGECLPLPSPGRSAGLHLVLVTGEGDEFGEHPVFYYAELARDVPEFGVQYPGFDVYLAHMAGVLDIDFSRGITALETHPDYGPRMRHHARHCFNGELSGFPFS
ncbi:hypothetical protein Skr01_38280 [Sphaerisporangium krabiense]|uniref:Uncharacterized protein n=1 Tax=Sphaerisporangium krabiense TaxID=763782 RepID=A0A7W8Z985_9ACTN|nr:hypothetical protein [Sphaerisporangium krabiense]MBB5629645.1 hypothetical protein [Sphaerisporangium krabiense]GII63743.1 hypothetical protein Skr01_38280 [Sphaerisporangium krabiense]